MIEEKFSCLKQVKKTVHIALPSAFVCNEIAGVTQILESWKRQYVEQLQGVVVSYKKVSLTSSAGVITVDKPFVHYDVKATFYLFCPTIGSIVKGKINRISREHIGCLVHDTINVTIYLSDDTSEEVSAFILLDHEILLQITHFDFHRKVIRVKGEITEECIKLMKEMYPDFSQADESNELSEMPNSAFDSSAANSSITFPPKAKKKRKRDNLSSDASSPASSLIFPSKDNTSPFKSSVSVSGGDITSDSLLSPINKLSKVDTSISLAGISAKDLSLLPSDFQNFTSSSGESTNTKKKKKSRISKSEIDTEALIESNFLKNTSNFTGSNISSTRNISFSKDDQSSNSLLSSPPKKVKKTKHFSTETSAVDVSDYISSFDMDTHLLETDTPSCSSVSPKKKKSKKNKSKHSLSKNYFEDQNLIFVANETKSSANKFVSPLKNNSFIDEDYHSLTSPSSPKLSSPYAETGKLDAHLLLQKAEHSSPKPIDLLTFFSTAPPTKKSKKAKPRSSKKVLNESNDSDDGLRKNENKMPSLIHYNTSPITSSLPEQSLVHKTETLSPKAADSLSFLSTKPKTTKSRKAKPGTFTKEVSNESTDSDDDFRNNENKVSLNQHNVSPIQNNTSDSGDDHLSNSLLMPYMLKAKSNIHDLKPKEEISKFPDTETMLNDISSTHLTTSSFKKLKDHKKKRQKKKLDKDSITDAKTIRNEFPNLNKDDIVGSLQKSLKKKKRKDSKINETLLKEELDSTLDKSSPLRNFDYQLPAEDIKTEPDFTVSSSDDAPEIQEKPTKKRKRNRESSTDMPKKKKRKTDKTNLTSKKVKDKDKPKTKNKNKLSKKDKNGKEKKKSGKDKHKKAVKKEKGKKSVHKKTKFKKSDQAKHKSLDKSKRKSHKKSKRKNPVKSKLKSDDIPLNVSIKSEIK